MATVAEHLGLAPSGVNVEKTRLSFTIQGPAMVLERDGKLRPSGSIGMWNEKGNLIVSATRLHKRGDVIGMLVRENGSTEPILHERHVLALDGGSIVFVQAIEADDEGDADEK